jgi:hypothetical protein
MNRYGYRRRRMSPGEKRAAICVGAALAIAALIHQPSHASTHTADAASIPVIAASSANSDEALANSMAAGGPWHWTGRQTGCLDRLWMQESGFRADALNPDSDATGIPQLNPAFHAVPAGWSSAAVQVRWGLGYVRSDYGSPCAAWAHEVAKGWY